MKLHGQAFIVETMKIILSRTLISLAVGFLAVACAETQPAPPMAAVGFAHLQPIAIKVSAIEMVSQYQSPLAPPNVEYRFSTPPSEAVLSWAEHRLNAVGGGGDVQARFVVTDASVVEVPVEKELTGIRSYFTSEVSVDYRARLAAQLIVEVAPGGPTAMADVVATRNMTVLENASLAEREKVWFEMTEALMADFDREMDRQSHTTLTRWVGE